MPVGSTIELYTTILGWILYDAIWGILAYTGLVLVPFIITIVNVVIETRDSAQEISAEGLIRILETRIYIMIGVVLFAAQPLINVNPSKTTYTQYRCGVTSSKSLTKTMTELAYGDSKSTLDKSTGTFAVMLDGRTPRAPIWWYLVTKLNHAITQTARQELPCQADLRMMGAGLSKLNIADKALKDELKDFYKDCWQPAARREWTVPMHSELKETLLRLIRKTELRRGKKLARRDYLFRAFDLFPRFKKDAYGRMPPESITNYFKYLSKKSNIRVGAHRFRHTFATTLCNPEDDTPPDVFAVQQLLGHTDLKTTRNYVQPRVHHLGRVLNRLGKLGRK